MAREARVSSQRPRVFKIEHRRDEYVRVVPQVGVHRTTGPVARGAPAEAVFRERLVRLFLQ